MQFLEALKRFDPYIIKALLVIQILGLIGIYSASYSENSLLIYKQILYITLGWTIILLIPRINPKLLFDISLSIYLINLLLIILVFLFGKTVYGAKRWLSLGFFYIQPTEFMKFSLLLISANTIPKIRKFFSVETLILSLIIAIPFLLTLKQPDLGTAVTFIVPIIFMLYVKGVKIRYFIGGFILVLLTLPILWNFMKPYQKDRIYAVLDPYSNYTGSGYQTVQSIITIGSGGIFGKGLLQGTQAHLLFLPEKHTDFIFSLIGEELGFFGTSILTVAFFVLLMRILLYANIIKTDPERLFIAGAFSLILFQSSVNILMTLGFMPVVGIPLPFVSFGGSSVITFSLIIGTLFSIIKDFRSRKIVFEPEKEINYE